MPVVTRAPTLGWTPGSLPRRHLRGLRSARDSPVRSTDALISAAFARVADAQPILDDRGEVQLVMLHIEIDGRARDRVLAAISGPHGVAMTRPDEGLADASVARIA